MEKWKLSVGGSIKKLCLLALCALLLCGAVSTAYSEMMLPTGVIEVEDEVFSGDRALHTVVVPEGVRRIGRLAFANSTLKRIYLPATLEAIDGSAFNGVSGLKCYVQAGSFAEFFCEDLGLSYEIVPGYPPIISQPQDLTVEAGQTAEFAVTALGSGYTYQWQTKFNADAAWANTNLGGNTTPVLRFSAAAAQTGRQYRCIIKDPRGIQDISKAVTLTVEPVVPVIPVTGVTMAQEEYRPYVGESFTLGYTIQPGNATNQAVTFASDNPGVAAVDAQGKVSVVGEGIAYLTVKTGDGGYTAGCILIAQRKTVLTLSASALKNLSPAGETRNISVTASGAWQAVSSASWLSVSPVSGSGTRNVSITAAKNTGAARAGTVTFTSGTLSQSLTVAQLAAADEIQAQERQMLFAWNGGEKQIAVSANGNWTAASDASWLTAEAVGAGYVKLTPSQYSTYGSPRTATVTLTCGSASDTISVTQNSKPFIDLMTNVLSYHPSYNGDQRTLRVSSNGAWTLSCNVDWISLSQLSGGTGEAGSMASTTYPLTITVQPNPDTQNERVGVITATNSGATATMTVTQGKRLYLDVTASGSLSSLKPAGDQITFQISSNANWTVQQSAAWAVCSPTSGTGNGTVTLSVSKNDTGSQRSAEINFAIDGETSKVTFALSQRHVSSLSVSPTALTFGHAGGSQTVTVDSTDSWLAGKYDSWITLSETGITNAKSLTITAEPNTGTSQRAAIITIDTNGGLIETIDVVQQPYDQISLNIQGLNASCEAYTASVQVTANGAWKAASSASWITVDKSSGSGSASVSISVAENTALTARSGSVTFTRGTASTVYRISQQAAPYRISVSPDMKNISSSMTLLIKTTVTANAAWTASSPSWITLDITSGGAGSTEVTMTAAANDSFTSSRGGEVTFTCGNASTVFVIVQAAKAYSVSLSSNSISVGSGAGAQGIIVTSNASWSASANVSWLHPGAASGSNGDMVMVGYDANTSTSARSGKVTFTCGSATAVLTISQAGAAAADINPGLKALSRSNYAVAYPQDTSNITPTYTDSSLKTRGRTDAQGEGYWIDAGDRCKIIEVGKNSAGSLYARVIYPTDSGNKEAYVYLSAFAGDMVSSQGSCTWPVYNLYVTPGLHQRTYSYTENEVWCVDKGDTVYTLAHQDGYYQIMYNISEGWRIAWCTEAAYTGNPPDDPNGTPDPDPNPGDETEKRNAVVAYAESVWNYTWNIDGYILLYNSGYKPSESNGALVFGGDRPVVATGSVRGIPYSLAANGNGAEKSFSAYNALSTANKLLISNIYSYNGNTRVSMKYGMSCATFVTSCILQGMPGKGLSTYALSAIHQSSAWKPYITQGSKTTDGYKKLQKGDYLYVNGHVRLVVGNTGSSIEVIEQTPPDYTRNHCSNPRTVTVSLTYNGVTRQYTATQVCMSCAACRQATLGTQKTTYSYSALSSAGYYPMYVNYSK